MVRPGRMLTHPAGSICFNRLFPVNIQKDKWIVLLCQQFFNDFEKNIAIALCCVSRHSTYRKYASLLVSCNALYLSCFRSHHTLLEKCRNNRLDSELFSLPFTTVFICAVFEASKPMRLYKSCFRPM